SKQFDLLVCDMEFLDRHNRENGLRPYVTDPNAKGGPEVERNQLKQQNWGSIAGAFRSIAQQEFNFLGLPIRWGFTDIVVKTDVASPLLSPPEFPVTQLSLMPRKWCHCRTSFYSRRSCSPASAHRSETCAGPAPVRLGGASVVAPATRHKWQRRE